MPTRRARAWHGRRSAPTSSSKTTMAGVPVRIVTPEGMPEANRDKVLLNLHGGGFNSDSGSYTESIPIACYTKIKVVAVLYRLAPEHPFPAAVDDAVAVYKELLKTYKPDHIVIYGTSAGAILTAEVAAKIKQLGLPHARCSRHLQRHGRLCAHGDSVPSIRLRGFSGHLDPPEPGTSRSGVSGGTDPRDPVLSPIYQRPAWPAAYAVRHQRPRYAAERHGEPAPRLSECRRRCAPGGLRRACRTPSGTTPSCLRRLRPTT